VEKQMDACPVDIGKTTPAEAKQAVERFLAEQDRGRDA
jgi:hypothetical protein